jgi:hypothetical protein
MINTQPVLKQWLGILLFLLGTGIGLTLTGIMTWGEMESNLAINIPDAKGLDLSCPLMLAYNETGIVQAVIVNETEKEVKPVIKAGFGQPDSLSQQKIEETHILAARKSQTLQWSIDASQSAFGRIIPVSIIQSRYSRNPPRWGACGVLLFSLFGLNGATSLALIIVTSLLLLAAGIFLTYPILIARGDALRSLRQAGGLLTFLTITALISAIFRWWGLSILIETISLIALGTFLIDSVFGQHKLI